MINVQHSIETHHITVDRTALVVDDGLAIHAEARTFVLRTLIGIGRSIAVIGGVGHIVLVGVGTTEDVEVLRLSVGRGIVGRIAWFGWLAFLAKSKFVFAVILAGCTYSVKMPWTCGL